MNSLNFQKFYTIKVKKSNFRLYVRHPHRTIFLPLSEIIKLKLKMLYKILC